MKTNNKKLPVKFSIHFSITYENGFSRDVTFLQIESEGRRAAEKAENYIKTNWQNIKDVQLKHWHIETNTGILKQSSLSI